MSIPERINEVLKAIPEEVKLVAVSKTKPNEDIMEEFQ
jgi:uncharacterized pyridoxal phosphate-containing UPF0001 family protein